MSVAVSFVRLSEASWTCYGFWVSSQKLGNEIRFRTRQNTHGIPAKRLSSHAPLERRFTLTFSLKFNNSNLYKHKRSILDPFQSPCRMPGQTYGACIVMRVDQLSEPMFSPYFKLLLNINPELVIQRLISQRALSPTGERWRCVTWPNNGCEGDWSKRDTNEFYFCLRGFYVMETIDTK